MDICYEYNKKTLCWQGILSALTVLQWLCTLLKQYYTFVAFRYFTSAKPISIYPSETERRIPALQLFGRRCNYSCWKIYCRKWSNQGIIFSDQCLLECLFCITVFYFVVFLLVLFLLLVKKFYLCLWVDSFTVRDPSDHSFLCSTFNLLGGFGVWTVAFDIFGRRRNFILFF